MRRHLVTYVLDSSPETKTFTSKKALEKWLVEFLKKYEYRKMDGYWIDLVITDIEGEIEYYE